MTKKTQMILGVGVLAVAGYLLWKQSSKKSFANLTASGALGGVGTMAMRCCGHTAKKENADSPSGFTFTCCNGQSAPYSNGNPCGGCPAPKGGTTAPSIF